LKKSVNFSSFKRRKEKKEDFFLPVYKAEACGRAGRFFFSCLVLRKILFYFCFSSSSFIFCNQVSLCFLFKNLPSTCVARSTMDRGGGKKNNQHTHNKAGEGNPAKSELFLDK
jgi:hypothetical protein